MMPFENIKELVEEYKKIWSLNYALSLMSWDRETYMPPADASVRGEVTGVFSELIKEEYLKLNNLVQKYEGKENLSDEEKGFIRVLNREIKYYVKVPIEIIKELDKIISEALIVWRNAKNEGNFGKFKPYLEKIVDLERKIAEYLGYEKHPYNALLDLYEEGFTVDDGDRIFNILLPNLKDILNKVREKGYYPASHPLESVEYEIKDMEKVNREILKLLKMPEDSFRMDVSAHPFTIRISGSDVRITTRYEGKDFKETIYSVVHESGHAIYELLIDKSLEMTPLAQGASTGIHESQSRFWENIIGRSKEFIHLVFPILKNNLSFLKDYDEEELHKYVNTVRPSLTRVDADEVTYNFHIALRYEIEKKLLNEDIKVEELPEIWNDFMEKYLGIRPKNDGEGILQDIHWSQGSIGYFPTYTLGNVVAGMIYSSYKNLKDDISQGNFDNVKSWLREKICKYGATYSPKELLIRAFGKTYDPNDLLKYLREKYLSI
ncbi:TPA: carboxypeptidase M32 [Sulfurisphaera tokodaii]|nr:carboxypeptidase M32 [Sulfurisphaera tokodaii]